MSKRRILITGGAGYIGSHVVDCLSRTEATVVVLDNLSTGFAEAVKGTTLIEGDLLDPILLDALFKRYAFDTIMHFAACTVIPESLEDPLKYYHNNTLGTVQLLDACQRYHVKYFIFSSTAAVYAAPTAGNVLETDSMAPLHPYGQSKYMSERIIQDVCQARGIHYAILRYFNVAGAHPHNMLGQKTRYASHLIKVAVETACGRRSSLPIFGTDYATPDGTCIRDYIHVCDLANIHLQALRYLEKNKTHCILNCGYGKGASVKEVIAALENICQKRLPVVFAPRREGDLPRMVADNTRLLETLDWKPQFDDLTTIVKTAYEYEKTLL